MSESRYFEISHFTFTTMNPDTKSKLLSLWHATFAFLLKPAKMWAVVGAGVGGLILGAWVL